MNRRTLKKHCKRAMETLIAKHGYRRAGFSQADGEETVYAPAGMERRHVRHGFLHPGALKGTWLYWSADYFGEGDYDLPISILREIQLWEGMTPEEAERLFEESTQWRPDLAASTS
jgi:hypothetical protein